MAPDSRGSPWPTLRGTARGRPRRVDGRRRRLCWRQLASSYSLGSSLCVEDLMDVRGVAERGSAYKASRDLLGASSSSWLPFGFTGFEARCVWGFMPWREGGRAEEKWNLMQEQHQPPSRAFPRPWFRGLWWLMVFGALAIAAVLLYRGDYLLGLLIGGLAIVRLAYIASFARRRRAFRSWYGPDRGPQGSGRLARSEFVIAAALLGLDPAQVRREIAQGRSLAELAGSAGVRVERIVDAVIRDVSSKIDQSVADGKLTQEHAVRLKAGLPAWATRLVNFHRSSFRG
jgi:hypothetical protein